MSAAASKMASCWSRGIVARQLRYTTTADAAGERLPFPQGDERHRHEQPELRFDGHHAQQGAAKQRRRPDRAPAADQKCRGQKPVLSLHYIGGRTEGQECRGDDQPATSGRSALNASAPASAVPLATW